MGTFISFRFPSGRYHATPWGSHANEASIEWPPSPWRVLRALIATWHRKIDPSEFSEDVLASLVDHLCSENPIYRLPAMGWTHTRHYMPVRAGRADRPALIFDAFGRVDSDDPLIVAWQDIDLPGREQELLGNMMRGIGYLGRAESWVEAEMLETYDGEFNSKPVERYGQAEHGTYAPVKLIVPLKAEAYAEWRDRTIAELGLSAARLPAAKKRQLAMLPERLVGALRAETSDLRNLGWSSPPGASVMTYGRPSQPGIPPNSSRNAARRQPVVTSARFAIAGRPLPRIEDAVRIGEIMRWGLIRKADDLAGPDGVPPEISGHGLPENQSHGHAFFLPEDADGDGRIDHVLVHASGGFSATAISTLNRLRRLWIDDGNEWAIILEGVWESANLSGSKYAGSARTWRTVTPYLRPWFAKKRFGTTEQVSRECDERGLAPPVAVRQLGAVRVHGRERRAVHFHRFRSKRGLRQPDSQGSLLELTFEEPVTGPLALGFGCHFGLGMFVPAA